MLIWSASSVSRAPVSTEALNVPSSRAASSASRWASMISQAQRAVQLAIRGGIPIAVLAASVGGSRLAMLAHEVVGDAAEHPEQLGTLGHRRLDGRCRRA